MPWYQSILPDLIHYELMKYCIYVKNITIFVKFSLTKVEAESTQY